MNNTSAARKPSMKMVKPTTESVEIISTVNIRPDANVYPVPVPFHLVRYIPKEYATGHNTIMLPRGKSIRLHLDLFLHIKKTAGESWFI